MGDDLIHNFEFVADMARFGESLATEQQIKKKWRFDDKTWEALGADEALVEAIELEKTRRIRSGAAKRERAQALVVEACGVLGEIMRDAGASPKHRIDASKALDAFADPGPTHAPDSSERFIIRIDLTAGGNKDDVILIDKSTGRRGFGDGEVLEPGKDAAPQRLIEAIAAKKDNDDDSRGGAW